MLWCGSTPWQLLFWRFSKRWSPPIQSLRSCSMERARKLADRLLVAVENQLVLVPCNVGEHWILTIIEPYKDCVYLMDPLVHWNRDTTWKYAVDTAMTIFNANKGRKKFKKPPK